MQIVNETETQGRLKLGKGGRGKLLQLITIYNLQQKLANVIPNTHEVYFSYTLLVSRWGNVNSRQPNFHWDILFFTHANFHHVYLINI